MGKPVKNTDNKENKGNSGNTNGGTETSFKNTPQAKDDSISNESFGQLNYGSLVFKFDILANDLGGNSKSLWSVDDGVNDSGAMDGYVAGDLLTQDFAGDEEYGQAGAMLSLTTDGQVSYDATSITSDLTALAEGEILTDEFIYAIRMANGTLSWAEASFSITGINDAPTLASGTLITSEELVSDPLDLLLLGEDVDSDDDGSTLLYSIIGTTPGGLASISGTNLLFDPSGDFETLAANTSVTFGLAIQATDSHGATAESTVSITVTGVNDAPTLADSTLAATEDGANVTLDLSTLGDDIDSDNDGSNLAYSLLTLPTGGLAAISGTALTFSTGSDFQSLAAGATTTFDVGIQAADAHGATADSTIAVTVTGVNDAPEAESVVINAEEDGSAVSASLIADDIDSDDDANSLSYTITGSPAAGSITNSGDGTVSFDPGADFQSLASGENAALNLTYTATDSHGEQSAPASLTINVTGVNDAPTLAAGSLAATEDGASVTLDLSTLGDDIDSDNDGSNLAYSLLTLPTGGLAAISGTALTFSTGSDFQSLAAGATTTFDVGIQAADAHGATADSTIAVTVTGVNDSPEAEAVGLAAVEDGGIVTGSFSGSDIDSDDDGSTLAYAINGTPGAGSISNNGDGSFSFDVGDDFQSLAAGEQTTANLGYTATDSHGTQSAPAALKIDVTGVNDAPTLAAGALTATEDGAPVTLDLSALGADIDSDNDGNDLTYAVRNGGINGFATVSGSNLEFDPTYEFDFLGEGETTIQELEVTATDRHGAQTKNSVSVTVTGENDASYITGGDTSGNYQLGASSNAGGTGMLGFADVDLIDTHSVSVTPIDSVEGSLTAVLDTDTTGSGTGGQVGWQYQVNNNAYASLGEGETTVESFIVSIDDGKSGGDTWQQVDITITGVNDVAELGSAVLDLIETDEVLTANGTLSILDADDGEAFFNPQTDTAGTYGTFSIDAAGNWNFATDGALDYLAEGETVSEFFTVSSLDGTESTVTVNITGTADGPTAVDDNGSLSASTVTARADNTVYWVDWQSITPIPGNAFGEVNVTGTLTLPDRTIDVTYTGQIYSTETYISPSNTTNYWRSSQDNGQTWLQGGDGVYTGTEVLNGPGDTNFDFIALALADTSRNVSFSEPVENLFFAVASMNNNGYLFDQPFTVVSSADSANDRGNWTYTDGINLTEANGQYGISTQGYSPNEFHGVLAINNAVQSLTWVSQSVEYWQGFTLGTYGIAQSATVAGNVLDNDDLGTALPVDVSSVDSNSMVGNSVTLNLASGAVLKVDRDGDYLYDDNGAFAALADGDSHLDTVSYTVEDDNGNTSSATLSIEVNGVNDAPLANDDNATVVENSSIYIDVLGNDTDIDTGDSLSIQSVAQASSGTAVIDTNTNSILYTPNQDFVGADSFSYTTIDAAGAASTATVDITVNREGETFTVRNLVANGSFENSTTGWSGYRMYPGSYSNAADGNRFLSLEHSLFSSDPYARQSISTQPGKQYTVGYSVSADPFDSSNEQIKVLVNGGFVDTAYYSGTSYANQRWDNHSFVFTASGYTSNLEFESEGGSFHSETWLDEVVMLSNESLIGFDKLLGDKLDLSNLMSSINAPDDSTAFSEGFLNFQASGSDTIIQIDPDGDGDGYLNSVTLVGVSLTPADIDNYIL